MSGWGRAGLFLTGIPTQDTFYQVFDPAQSPVLAVPMCKYRVFMCHLLLGFDKIVCIFWQYAKIYYKNTVI